MSTGFSGIVRLADFNDFIGPSQKCILPQTSNSLDSTQKLVSIRNKLDRKKLASNAQKDSVNVVKLSLSDCLACSGCVTTAEQMLVDSQTVDQMIKGVQTKPYSVVTISPQSLCSLANDFDLAPKAMAKRLVEYFKGIGVNYIIDSSFGRLLSKKLHYDEFRAVKIRKNSSISTIFTGICPGFVCYAEKTHGNLLVPLISHIRSPQSISGRLVKDFLAKKLQIQPDEIFHICLMPCYDKKLEASRKDFFLENDVPEVDCVVTASELKSLLNETAQTRTNENELNSLCNKEDFCWLNSFERGRFIGDGNDETSGGYADYIENRILGEFPNSKCEKTQKTKDYEITTISTLKNSTFSIAKIYGFRNIQNVVQKLKRDKFSMDFVEIMACPSGCVNGGGQIRAETTELRQINTEKINNMYSKFAENEEPIKELEKLEFEWENLNRNYKEHLFTDYKPIEKISNNNITNLVESW